MMLPHRQKTDGVPRGGDSARHRQRGNVWRYDGAGGGVSEICMQSRRFPQTENRLAARGWPGYYRPGSAKGQDKRYVHNPDQLPELR